MKRARHLSSRAKAAFACFILPLAITPIYYGAKEFQTIASWYGPGFQGRRTASGARFDTNQMTAASKTLPFGTSVLVVNPKNGRECEVVINDRGPYVPGRGIDLSHAAARRLGIGGVAPVICYVGGRSYSDLAQKRKHHEDMNSGPASEPVTPPPSLPEPNDIAQESPAAHAVPQNLATAANQEIVSNSAQNLVAAIPPGGLSSAIVSSADRRQSLNVAEPQGQSIVGRSEQANNNNVPQIQQSVKTQQIPNTAIEKSPIPATGAQADKQIAQAPTNSNQVVEKTVPVVGVRLQPKPVEVQVATKPKSDTTANSLPGTVNGSFKMSTRKPGELLAAAEHTPYIYAMARPQVSAPVYTYVQYPGRYSVPITSRALAMPTAQATTASHVVPARAHSGATGSHYVVAHRVYHRYRRHYYTVEKPDLLDSATTKIAHVCKSILAKL